MRITLPTSGLFYDQKIIIFLEFFWNLESIYFLCEDQKSGMNF